MLNWKGRRRMRGQLCAIVLLAIFLFSQFFYIQNCSGQIERKSDVKNTVPAEQPKFSKQQKTEPSLSYSQKDTIRRMIKEETESWKMLVGIVVTVLIALFGIVLWQSVRWLKKKAKSQVQEITSLLNQSRQLLESIEAVRHHVEEHAKKYSVEFENQGHKILANLGKTFSPRPRYAVTQGGNIEDPSWEFDLVIFGTNKQSEMKGLVRASGGNTFNTLSEQAKNSLEWHECIISLRPDNSICIVRPLIGEHSGKQQMFLGSFCNGRIIKDKTAWVWQGHWQGYGAETDPGAFIIYLD